MHGLGSASMLANQLDCVPVGLSFECWLFGLGQGSEPLILLILLMRL